MHLKSIIATALAAIGLAQRAQAQNLFDEMVYTAQQTVFHLNSPTESSPVTSKGKGDVAVDGITGASSLSNGEEARAKSPRVVVRIYDSGLGGKAVKTVKMKKDGTNRWKAVVKGDLQGKFYTFDAGYGETPGVFAKAVGVNGKRGAIVDLPAPSQAGKIAHGGAIYELHIRDFSIARPEAKHPGKFLALTEPWAIDHLKRLGIAAVHILPAFDFGSIDETRLDSAQYNWGYDPVNYNVPEGSYSTNPYDPAVRISEFKQMVGALHRAGIGVILDVVYNHTFDLDNSNFQKTWPDAYYRFTADGKPSNGSGCGNETASERPLMREFMIESVKYWATEYGIDGFRFDLMGCHDIETMNAIRAALDSINPNIFIYGEGWSAGPCALPQDKLAMKANMSQMPGIAAFCDDMRDALRGPFSDDTKGAFLVGIPGSEESLKAGIAGMTAHPQVDYSKVNYSRRAWAAEPTQCINYVSCHDDMCLVDRLKATIAALPPASKARLAPPPPEGRGLTVSGDSTNALNNSGTNVLDNHGGDVLKHTNPIPSGGGGASAAKPRGGRASELIALDLLAQTAVFTSQGTPFMLSGEEMLRDKKGVHNSFCSPDSVNELPWGNMQRYPEVFDYYSRLIALRRHHPAFSLSSADLVRKHLEFLPVQPCLVAFRLKDNAGGDAWRDIIVVLNANREARDVAVPDGTYTVVCRDGKIDEQGLGTVSGTSVTVPAQSAMIIYSPSPGE